MQYQESSNNILIIHQSIKLSCPCEPIRRNGSPLFLKYYRHCYEKMTFSLHYITYLLLSFKSSTYSLVRESDRNMQYWLSSNHILIINPSYNVHHVHESQSDGMDHQWFQNTILFDITKMTFLHIISLYLLLPFKFTIFFGAGTWPL